MKKLMMAMMAAASFGLFADDPYIEGTGTQAIMTDAVCNQDGKLTRLEIDFQLTKIINQERVFGLCYAAFESQLFVQDDKFQFAVGDTWTGYPTTITADTVRHTAVADYKNKKIAIRNNGVDIWSADITNPVTKTSSRGQGIFGSACAQGDALYWNWMRSEAKTDYAHMRFYSLKVYDDDVLTHYYKPWKSADGKHVGVKDLCTGKLLVNCIDGTQFLASAGVTDDPQWDLAEPQPTIAPTVIPTEGDYVIDTTYGAWFLPRFNSSVRIVKKGPGMLVLDDGNEFNGQTFLVSDGALIADYEASGLNRAHLELNGSSNWRPGVFMPVGDSFTAAVGSSGEGTISLQRCCGFRPYDADLTVNLGGAGAALVKGADGFNPIEFDLGMSAYHALTLENDITLNANVSITLKNPGKDPMLGLPKPAYLTGYISNAAGFSNKATATITYWDGEIVFVGDPGRTCDMYAISGWQHNCGTQVFTNYKFNVQKDWVVGNLNAGAGAAVEYFKDCSYNNNDAWDQIAGGSGTTLTVDGGTFNTKYRYFIGNPWNNGTCGTLVLTNDARFTCGTLRVHNGTVNQYGGVMSSANGDTLIFGVGVTASNDDVNTSEGNSGDSAYNLYGGKVEVRDFQAFHVGATHKGTFRQLGGEVTVNNTFALGNGAKGVGRYDLLGGTCNHCPTTNRDKSVQVGVAGSGELDISSGGKLVSAATPGVKIGANQGGKGVVCLAAGGVAEVSGFSGGAGSSRLVFAGGTARTTANTANYVPGFIADSVNSVEMTAEGGAIDTAAGDVSLGKTIAEASPAAAGYEGLTHRWSFEDGSLVDSVSGVKATTVGTTAVLDGTLVMPGGAWGTSEVNFGNDLLPNDGRGFTLETWFTVRGFNAYSQMIASGLKQNGSSFHVSVCQGGEGSKWYMRFGGTENRATNYAFVKNKPYYLSFVMEKTTAGWTGTVTIRDPETAEVYDRKTIVATKDWTPSALDLKTGLWLGNGAWKDKDPNMECREFRIYSRALTEAQLDASVRDGMRAKFAFRKAGANKLTIYGANAYRAGTMVEAGTLQLATGATIPQTDVTVASGATLDLAGTSQTVKSLAGDGTVKGGVLTLANAAGVDGVGKVEPGDAGKIGTLTLDGATLGSGRIVIDVAADGTAADRLVVTERLDLSKLSLTLKGIGKETPKAVHPIIVGPVTGAFASANLPRGWSFAVSANGVELVPNGIAIIIR